MWDDRRWYLDGLVFNEGVDADGCGWAIDDESGWSDSPFDADSPRVIGLSGWVSAPTRQARLRAEKRLAAVCLDPANPARQWELRCTEETGDLTAMVRRADKPLVVMDRGGYGLTFRLLLEAPDPRKYAAPTVRSVQPPQSTGGLDWAAPAWTPVRTNTATQPQGGTWTPYNAGGSVAYTASLASPPALPGVAAGTTATCTTAGMFGATRPAVTAVTAGHHYTASAYVRPSVTRDVRVYMEWRDAANAVLATNFATTTAVPGGSWSRIQINRAAPAGATQVLVSTVTLAAAVGETLAVTALLVERMQPGGTANTYFDGATPGHGWTGTAFASTSVYAPEGLNWGAGLAWGTVVSTGSMVLSNPGAADAPVTFVLSGSTVAGEDLVNPRIVAPTIDGLLLYTDRILSGQTVEIDTTPRRRTVLLGGTADRRVRAAGSRWFTIPPRTDLLVSWSADVMPPTASLTAIWSPAHW